MSLLGVPLHKVLISRLVGCQPRFLPGRCEGRLWLARAWLTEGDRGLSGAVGGEGVCVKGLRTRSPKIACGCCKTMMGFLRPIVGVCVFPSCEILITAARLTASTMIRNLHRGKSSRNNDYCACIRLSVCVIESCRGNTEEVRNGREKNPGGRSWKMVRRRRLPSPFVVNSLHSLSFTHTQRNTHAHGILAERRLGRFGKKKKEKKGTHARVAEDRQISDWFPHLPWQETDRQEAGNWWSEDKADKGEGVQRSRRRDWERGQ